MKWFFLFLLLWHAFDYRLLLRLWNFSIDLIMWLWRLLLLFLLIFDVEKWIESDRKLFVCLDTQKNIPKSLKLADLSINQQKISPKPNCLCLIIEVLKLFRCNFKHCLKVVYDAETKIRDTFRLNCIDVTIYLKTLFNFTNTLIGQSTHTFETSAIFYYYLSLKVEFLFIGFICLDSNSYINN